MKGSNAFAKLDTVRLNQKKYLLMSKNSYRKLLLIRGSVVSVMFNTTPKGLWLSVFWKRLFWGSLNVCRVIQLPDIFL